MDEVCRVVSVARDEGHRFSKRRVGEVRLIAGRGVEGDAHCGETVQHRSRVASDPDQPNLRQVHLLAEELLDELAGKGFVLAPADMGENITTRGIDLLALPRGTRLRLGAQAIVEITGLRNPCGQIETFRPGLLLQLIGKDEQGAIIRRAGVMSVVVADGVVRPGDGIAVLLPVAPYEALDRV